MAGSDRPEDRHEASCEAMLLSDLFDKEIHLLPFIAAEGSMSPLQ
jgi:hypothetical protein